MPEIDEEVTFDIGPDQAELTTKTNGDLLLIRGIHLTAEQAATLAWLVNHGTETVLEITVSVKEA